MQVILLEKVINLGNLGDLIKVKAGYARNYLIPQKKARRATDEAVADFQAQRAMHEKAAQEKFNAAEKQAQLFENFEITIAQKAGVDGRLFGSVTQADICNELQKRGYQIDKAQIKLGNGHIKIVGRYPVDLALHTDVTSTIHVSVVAS